MHVKLIYYFINFVEYLTVVFSHFCHQYLIDICSHGNN